jgi:hypothetical protein
MDICGGDDNWFVAHFMYCMASDGGMIDEWWIGNYLGGDSGLVEIQLGIF